MIDWAKIILEIRQSGMNSRAIAVWCQLHGVERVNDETIRKLTYRNKRAMLQPRWDLGDALLELHRKLKGANGRASA